MFLESKSQLLGNMLADWANFYNGYLHGGPSEEEEASLAQHPWKILYKCILDGSIGDALRLIDDELIPIETRQDDILRWAAETLREILTSVPHLNSTGAPLTEFGSKWETWLIKVRHAKQGLNEKSHRAPPELIKQLSITFSILLGDSQIIEQVTNGEYWARVAATLRWTDPMATKSKFVTICESILFNMEGSSAEAPFSSSRSPEKPPEMHPVIKALLDIENDLHLVNAIKQLDEGVMNVSNSKFKFPWMAAHLVDILVHGHRQEYESHTGAGSAVSSAVAAVKLFLKRHDGLPVGCNLREYYIHSYATALQTHSLHTVALDYLGTLQSQAKLKAPTGNTFVSRIFIRNDRHAMKLLNQCTRSAATDIDSFDDTKLAICASRAAHWARLQRLGQSMQWAIRSGSERLIDRYSKVLLKNCLDTSDFSALEAVAGQVDGVGNYLSNTMVFLIRYRDLQAMLKEIAVLEASLHSNSPSSKNRTELLESKEKHASHEIVKLLQLDLDIPKKVYFSLLHDYLLPMLSRPRPVVSVEDTFLIMHTLERLELFFNKKPLLQEELPTWDYVRVMLDMLLTKYQVTIDMANNTIGHEVYSMLRDLLPYLPDMASNALAANTNFVHLDELQEAYNNKREEENEEREINLATVHSLRYALSQNLSLSMIQNA